MFLFLRKSHQAKLGYSIIVKTAITMVYEQEEKNTLIHFIGSTTTYFCNIYHKTATTALFQALNQRYLYLTAC